ncbi:hypothetical protein UKMH10_1621 [Burkholderia pseudomallei]|uniref:Uncharacterized protein n=2 Tax=Burkholderia pseudomallei TaxID=28450 RepID=A3NUH2_BURP0|nr:conserved hypothetical protein [Burkholderia pseudomallei 1106a]EEH24310.1 conserved hypothetical protein [Burkholderia pseudomallei Pakistan 9]VUD47995.1 hypothetical protein UKMH10_1621 [Burkholderia pseudomallei]
MVGELNGMVGSRLGARPMRAAARRPVAVSFGFLKHVPGAKPFSWRFHETVATRTRASGMRRGAARPSRLDRATWEQPDENPVFSGWICDLLPGKCE